MILGLLKKSDMSVNYVYTNSQYVGKLCIYMY